MWNCLRVCSEMFRLARYSRALGQSESCCSNHSQAGEFVQLAHHRAFFGDFGVFLRGKLGERESHEIRDPFHRAVKINFFVFLDELEHVPARTAGKALVDADGRVYRHGGGVVVVEGAYAHVAVRTRALQRQELLDHERDVRLRLELLNNFIRVERHACKNSFFL